ncbi:GH25 family lysozyme [Clostridium perfringens]|uniref:GH25 family lysozyme n=2 Tax=Clostridium perfringens TaxID=1502 RepID=UPI00016BD59B|nr:GH25 family lysozyme [Clostridium perfringens]AXP19871.1 ZP278 lysin [synthetic construct]EDT26105.1 glycosyl hydrolase, family 25 [Clostridium perfringens CPE str. F4969]
MQSRSDSNFKGIDISNWQKGINLNQLKERGYDVCYIKITEGKGYVDPCFEENYNKAIAAGMKVGVYHYWRGTSSAIEQANNIVRTLGNKHIDCKIAIDVEQTDGLSYGELNNSVLQLAEELERLIGAEVCIYCNTNYARNVLDSRLGKYSLWVAHYGVNKPGDNPIWDKWAGFQYSENGTSNVNGSLDLDEFTEEIFINKESSKVTENKLFSTNARALVALDPRDNPSDNYNDLGEIYEGERIQVLAEVCDKEDYLPVKYWKDSEGRESGKVWIRSKQDYMMIDTYHRVFNVITQLDARYEPSSDSATMGYVKNGERLYVHRTEGNYSLCTYFAGNGYKTAWFTAKYLERI